MRSLHQMADWCIPDSPDSVCREHRHFIELVVQQMAVCRRKAGQHRALEAQRQREDWVSLERLLPAPCVHAPGPLCWVSGPPGKNEV